MIQRIDGTSNSFTGINNSRVKNNSTENNENFSKILAQKQDQVKISKHARQRLSARNLDLQNSDLSHIGQAMNELNEKGSKDSLLLYKDMGLIANVQNRTIITAMNVNEINTVTNIDSTKFVK
ncbi:flagellar protein [Liquorilactobacillus hordei]|uniref:Flagellar operon protein n=3 Tax=Liquorilactobacillus hordei TaxID=468911 RepID=A0A0A7RFS6_9LACO|nr:flagellar protein [Liquorilactobacillus hordei]AJA34050.1 flagellar operon protein [Liquorilactobacillus hordei]KRL06062.1 flagellar operon protein [Liquorilactobacillus hordei DSM 19519]QYH51343.1 flagellar protein [Liquorilactobacillus hordei DSM 19519]